MNNLRELREKRKLQQKDVAEILNVDRSSVSAWETGKNTPPTKMLPKLAGLYKCSITKILRAIEVI